MNYYNIGKIVNTQGLKGEVRVISITDFPDKRFKVGNTVFAKLPNRKEMVGLTIDSVRKHKGFILLHFKNHPSINDVEYLKPSELKIDEDSLSNDDLKPGEYYYHQIIGLDVVDPQGNEIGQVKEILSPGANDVWVVERDGQKDLLLPKIDSVITNVDLDAGKITADVPEGLDE
ncbi:ribosome maturation factor RimM [Lentilactobacillus otakiensis]|jgi:16S rRNA processing protein RimM|uniref:Ribosome maturation factor RimM n=1 Tax=Lentilactobacillus otakiensis DSM 19908 = JCM 15040 TaxID=1423780 RepID=S4PN97_9LACO|nr:ribosome maturation factor RimM [Lentilactobacillus otakiensis]KRL09226.1 ribosome maturation factor rimM [Lentilactobacillus otakiensis DSM 19908 = JCM 15040]MBZ3776719.1 ribosome maturation factor RimM [Lentilactobacillus otakiensis]MDV3519062.1 ribosome maturation factor RimM [Lentilactobacillus otakiensis]GAD15770.1 ribosome maturation factor rimM [Lentilactobacillus otakiensis DSM 19908 = JCM 15040]